MPYGSYSEHGTVRFQMNLSGRVGDALSAVKEQLKASPGQSRYRDGLTSNELITMLLLHWLEHRPDVEWVMNSRDRANSRRTIVDGPIEPFRYPPPTPDDDEPDGLSPISEVMHE
jgi:hypothetical protein